MTTYGLLAAVTLTCLFICISKQKPTHRLACAAVTTAIDSTAALLIRLQYLGPSHWRRLMGDGLLQNVRWRDGAALYPPICYKHKRVDCFIDWPII